MAAVADLPNNLYLLDSMGLTTSVALGLAVGLRERGRARRRDRRRRSLLMNLGSLATIGAYGPRDLTILLLDNGDARVGRRRPDDVAARIDLCRVAEGCGIVAREVLTTEELVAGPPRPRSATSAAPAPCEDRARERRRDPVAARGPGRAGRAVPNVARSTTHAVDASASEG